MKFEDRVQLKLSDLTEELFEKIVAYGFYAPSGMGGPGCVIMIAEDGRSYQFYGPELNNLNYHREWASLFPVLNQCDTRQWKLAENVSCTKLFVRNDIYDLGKLKQLNMKFWWRIMKTIEKKCLHKHIDENHIKATPGKLLILSGFSGVGKGTVIQQLLTEYPEKVCRICISYNTKAKER